MLEVDTGHMPPMLDARSRHDRAIDFMGIRFQDRPTRSSPIELIPRTTAGAGKRIISAQDFYALLYGLVDFWPLSRVVAGHFRLRRRMPRMPQLGLHGRRQQHAFTPMSAIIAASPWSPFLEPSARKMQRRCQDSPRFDALLIFFTHTPPIIISPITAPAPTTPLPLLHTLSSLLY